ncbi:MAG: hypothetical protein MJZ61_08615 [Bacteroidales bacterium]|nr:hypothetical protein [Bacteroidales bacterium]
MKTLFHILLFLLPSFAGGQKFLRNSIDSLYLVDIANMQSYGLLSSEKTGFAVIYKFNGISPRWISQK